MLRALTLTDWKSFGAAGTTLPFAPLTVMVGPNASGKSNVLDAIRFLQGAARDYPLADVFRGRYEGQLAVWTGIRGGAFEAARSGQKAFTIASTWELKAPLPRVSHELSIDLNVDPVIDRERLVDLLTSDVLFDASDTSGPGSIHAVLLARIPSRHPKVRFSSDRSLLGQMRDDEFTHADTPSVCEAVRTELREATFLDIRPELMRDYRPKNGGHLGASGENISPMLFAQPEQKRDAILSWLSELSVPEVTELQFDVTMVQEVMLMLVQHGVRTSVRAASDGTLRFLGLVAALLTAEAGTIVILEEPDAGLHPARIRVLVDLLEQVTAERGIQVILTSHSPTLVAYLSPGSLADVIAFGRAPETGDTVCRRAGDLPHFATLRDADNIEQLISSGWLERAL